MRPDIKKRAQHRLKIILGQIEGLQKMLTQEKYCLDMIYQARAVQEALSSFEDLILDNHFATHLPQQIQSGQKNKIIKEFLTLYKVVKKSRRL